MRALTLVVPGICDSGLAEGRAAALARLSARADPCTTPAIPHAPYEGMLCGLFGIRAAPGHDLPIAALTHLVDFDADHDGAWMRADPVYLRADLGRLRLLAAGHLVLGRDEASALAAELAGVFAEHGFLLHIGRDPRRWYLRLPEIPEIVSQPPSVALGADIEAFLPRGPERRFWHRLANDVQMILYGAAINTAREERGEPPINSLWFWGAGALPEPGPVDWAQIFADDAPALGLARHFSLPHAPLPEGAYALCRQGIAGHVLAVLGPDHPDPVQQLDERWFAPLLSMLKRRTLGRLTVHTATRGFTITSRGAWRVWR